MNRISTLVVSTLLLILVPNSVLAQHFKPVEPTNIEYEIQILTAIHDGVPLDINDEIGIFDRELCVGALTVDVNWPVTVSCWGNDDNLPGYRDGAAIGYRLWDSESENEYGGTIPHYESRNGNFGFIQQTAISLLFMTEPHFEGVDHTGSHYAFIINSATVMNEPLQPGDEIAVFDGDLCAGMEIVGFEWPVVVSSWERDLGTPGFTPGIQLNTG